MQALTPTGFHLVTPHISHPNQTQGVGKTLETVEETILQLPQNKDQGFITEDINARFLSKVVDFSDSKGMGERFR